MKTNLSMKVLTGVVLSVVMLILLFSGKAEEKTEVKADPNNINEAMASQFNDNIREVSARIVQREKKERAIDQQNKEILQKIEQLSVSKEQGGGIVKQEVPQELLNTVESLKQELAQLKAAPERSTLDETYPIGQHGARSTKSTHQIYDIDEQIIKHQLSEDELNYWNKLNERRKAIQKSAHHPINTETPKPKKKVTRIPYYTIPAGSDLGNTTLLSALIGEVPIEGRLMQPLFPFSALISRGDLMASNGVPLPPEISGMKVNGYAIGVGSFLDNISCARAYVTSVLFTFQDGHFVVVGQEKMTNSVELVNNESLGYLTTEFGNPCIPGEYHTNAPRVLAAMMGASGAKGAGNALSQWQMTYFAGPNGGAAAPTGSMGQYAAGGAVAEGAADASDWLKKRIQGSFDMVFVSASVPYRVGSMVRYYPRRMSLHLTQTINLDKKLQGRVLDYGHLQNYAHDFSLK